MSSIKGIIHKSSVHFQLLLIITGIKMLGWMGLLISSVTYKLKPIRNNLEFPNREPKTQASTWSLFKMAKSMSDAKQTSSSTNYLSNGDIG
jgi:hypothetical protein